MRNSRVVFALLMLTRMITAQDLNPPYPRLGMFTFSGGEEACIDILKDMDVIAISPMFKTMGQAYRDQNPDRIVLGTSGCLYAWGMSDLPEAWYYHDYLGNRIPLFGNYALMNLTTMCDYVDIGDGHGPERFIDHCLNTLPEDIDLSIFQGVMYDWWWSGPGTKAKNDGDLDRNGVRDRVEWGLDSVITVWTDGLLYFHEEQLKIPGLEYVVIQIGTTWRPVYPLVNGFCWEDWPVFNGPFRYWRGKYNDDQCADMLNPKLNIMNAAHRHFYRVFPVNPYKNNFTAIRYAFASGLLTGAYFFVDEGNEKYPDDDGKLGIGHHGNFHVYDEMAGKGRLGYPVSDMTMLPGKPLASTPMAEGVWVRYFDNGVSVVNATGLNQTITASELAAYDSNPGSFYYRFQGGQDPLFNNGEEVTDGNPLILWGSTAMANWSDPEVFGDGVMLFRYPDTLITPIVVDNHVNNQTSPGSEPIQNIGNWTLTSTGKHYYAFYKNRNYGPFQPDGFAWSNAGSGENVALYIPTIGLNAYYKVSEWHGYRDASYANATDVPVRIQYAGGGDSTVTVNQAVNMGQWNSLGVYPFVAGVNGRVELSNDANGYVMADAIQFEFVRGFTAEEEDSLGGGGGTTAMFTDISASTIGDTQNGTSGCAFADISGDGLPDLYITRLRGAGSTDLCYISVDGASFTQDAVSRGIQDTDGGSVGACWGDLDNDGDFDLVNGTMLRMPEDEGEYNTVYRNEGGGYFTDQTDSSILLVRRKTRSVLLADINSDNWLDIYSVPGYKGSDDTVPWGHPNEVFKNEMAFAFTALAPGVCGDLVEAPAAHGCTAADFDNDGDIDIFAANHSGNLNVLINNGSGFFSLVADLSSIGIDQASPQAGSGISLGDVDNDGDLDLLLVSIGPPSLATLYFNDGDGTFTQSMQSWSDVKGYMGGFADLDNDRDLDLVFAGHTRAFLNDGTGHFDSGPLIPYLHPVGSPRSLAFADIDNDGDLDFAVTDLTGKGRLIRNDFSNSNHYLKIRVITPAGQAGGFGAKVFLYRAKEAGGQIIGYREIQSNYGYNGQDDPVVHFGLGELTAADVTVIYQDGTRQTSTFTAVDREVEMDGREIERRGELTVNTFRLIK